MSDLSWFDYMCDVLKTENKLSKDILSNLIESHKVSGQSQEVYSLIGFDQFFEMIELYPFLEELGSPNAAISQLFFSGENIIMDIQEIVKRFPKYLKTPNMYDGGMQIFFYPIPDEFLFRGISIYPEKEHTFKTDLSGVSADNITFMFGNTLEMMREGYTLTR